MTIRPVRRRRLEELPQWFCPRVSTAILRGNRPHRSAGTLGSRVMTTPDDPKVRRAIEAPLADRPVQRIRTKLVQVGGPVRN
jgi:hypothetical protein